MAKLTCKQLLEAFPNDLEIYYPKLISNNNYNNNGNCNGTSKPAATAFTLPCNNNYLSEIILTNITWDSRNVNSNSIYVVLNIENLLHSKYKEYINLVKEIPTIIIISELEILDSLDLDLTTTSASSPIYLKTPNAYKTLSQISKLFYPLHPDNLIAVTGTNGKTSIVNFTQQILTNYQIPNASLGTLGLNVNSNEVFNPSDIPITKNTTTYSPIFHNCCNVLKSKYNINHLIFEASSHGLNEYRIHGLMNLIQIGIFTNFTQDHLDYHKNMENYFIAKCKLFNELIINNGTGIAFICNKLDQNYIQRLKLICKERNIKIWIYGENYGDLYYQIINYNGNGNGSGNIIANFNFWGIKCKNIILNNFPKFQYENLLVSIGIVITLLKMCNNENEIQKLVLELPNFIKSIPGRMDFAGVKLEIGAKIFVDYAHTPEGIEIALSDLKHKRNGKLILVFGAGGNRDKKKRPKMGYVAAKFSTHIIITDDNPRCEDPALIRAQILEGIKRYQVEMEASSSSTDDNQKLIVEEVGDRKEAIKRGIEMLDSPEDILIVAGKGHETYQIMKDKVIDFNDKEVINDLLSEIQE